MKVELISCVNNNESFMKHFSSLITDDLDNKSLQQYAKLTTNKDNAKNVKDKRLIKYTLIEDGKAYPLLPILNKHNTELLATKFMGIANDFALESKPTTVKISSILSDKSGDLVHNIINHFVLANLWQKIYAAKIHNVYGGSVLVVDNPQECKVVYSKMISINSSQLVVYWLNSLQGNNYVYDKLLENGSSKKMLRSCDSNGVILPYGSMEDHFVKLKLAATKRMKGSLVPTFFSNLPILDTQIIKGIRNEMIELTRLFNRYYSAIMNIIRLSKGDVFSNHEYVSDCHLLQAGYYVWCYAIYHEWLNTGVLKPLKPVKDVFGVQKII